MFHVFQDAFSPTRIFTNIFKQQFLIFKHTYQTVLNYSPFELYYYNASHVEWLTKLKNWNRNAKIQSSMKKRWRVTE